jgi:hypothetical protein
MAIQIADIDGSGNTVREYIWLEEDVRYWHKADILAYLD